jgi:tetratricopeptide (TPR) repeat protein
MKWQRFAAACVTALMAFAAQPTGAADNWVEVTSPNFRVVSNNGERSAREVAWQFEEVRAAIAQGWRWAQAPLDRPLLIIGMKDENTMKSFAPGYYERGQSVRYSSISTSDWDRHYIGLRADLIVDGGEGVNPYQSAYWTYCNLMLSSSFHSKLPMWFTRGLAEVLSNTNVTDKEVQVGRAMPSNIQEFKSGARYPLEQLFTMTRQSPELRQQIALQRFDAEAWAVMHYMLFGDASAVGRESRLNTLAAALSSGASSLDAVARVYGSLADLDAAYRGYVDRGMFRFVTMKMDIKISPKEFSARPMTPAEVAAARAGYLTATNRPIEARAAIDQARQFAPESPVSYEVEGLLLEHGKDMAGATAAYTKATELQSANFLPYVRLALMQREPGPDAAARRRALLEKSVALNANYPQAQQGLSAALIQLGEFEAALTPARRAVELNPADVFGRTTLAGALARAGKKDEAIKEVQAAAVLARTDREKQVVQQTVEMIDRIK